MSMGDLSAGVGGFSIGSPLFTGQLAPNDISEQDRLALVIDTIASQMGSEEISTSPLPSSSKPQLPKPTGGRDGGALGKVLNKLQNLPQQAQNLMAGVGKLVGNFVPDGGDEQFINSINRGFDELPDSAIASNFPKGTTRQEAKSALLYAMMNPDAEVPPGVRKVASEIAASAEATGVSGPSSQERELYNTLVNGSYEMFLQGALEMEKLPEGDRAKLLFAHNVPDAKEGLTPQQLKSLVEAEARALKEMQKEFGVPPGWQPPIDPQAYEANIGSSYSLSMGDQLLEMKFNGELSTEQYEELRTLLYFPGTQTPNVDSLKPIFDRLATAELSSLQKQQGIPEGYTPLVGTHSYESILNGSYQMEIGEKIRGLQPPLSAKEQRQLLAAISSPAARQALPAAMLSTLEGVEMAALAAVKGAYSLPQAWAPDPVMLGQISASMAQGIGKLSNSSLNIATEWVGNSTALAAEMAAAGKLPAADYGVFKDFLKAISVALNELRATNYLVATKDGEVGHILNRIQNQAKLDQIEKQRKQLKEVMEKMQKMATMGPIIMAIMVVVMLALIAAAIASMGALAPLLVPYVSAMQSVIGGASVATAEAIATMLSQAAVAMTVMGATMTILSMDPGTGSALTELAKAFKASEKTQQALNMAAMIMGMVLMMMAAAIMLPGASSASLAPKVAGDVAKGLQKGAQWVASHSPQWLKDLIKPLIDTLKSAADKYSVAAEKAAELQAKFEAKLAQNKAFFANLGSKENISENVVKQVKSKFETLVDDLMNADKQIAKLNEQLAKAKSKLAESPTDQAQQKLVKELTDELDKATKARTKLTDEFTAFCKGKSLPDATCKEMVDMARETSKMQGEMMKMVESFSDTVTKMTISAQMFGLSAKTFPDINNKVLQAQIARIKGDFEAYSAEIDQIIKAIKAIVDKLLNGLKGALSEVSAINDLQQKIIQDLSATISNMCGAI